MKKAVSIMLFLLTILTGVPCTPVFASQGEEAGQSDMIASDDERATQSDVGKEDDTPIYAGQVESGDYEIDVDSSSSMFRIVGCVLHVTDEGMTADMKLSGKGYLKLFMGTGEEAVKADEETYIPFEEDAEGMYVYTVPVEALNKDLECTGFSKRKEKWYDHQISFRAEKLPEGAVDLTAAVPADQEAAETEEPAEEEITSESEKPEEGSAADEPKETEAAAVPRQKVSLADGVYRVPVTLAGGSGRASVTSPAEVTVADGLATAKIEWSSPNYDYMIINGEKLLPVSAAGENSVFEIPVLLMDAPFPVVADTTAMSVPHEIDYELTFESAGAKPGRFVKLSTEHLPAPVFVGIFVAIAAAVVIAIIFGVVLRKKDKDEL